MLDQNEPTSSKKKMSENYEYVRQLEDWCVTNQIPVPVFDTSNTEGLGYVSNLSIGLQTKSIITLKHFGRTEAEAQELVAKKFMIQNMDKSYEELTNGTIRAQNVNKADNSLATGLPDIPNPIGYLCEFSSKNAYPFPQYTETGMSGDDHKRVFTIKCEITVSNGLQIIGEGKGHSKKEAKKLATLEVIKQLPKQTDLKSNLAIDKQILLKNYFQKNFCYSQELNQCLSGVDMDSVQQLEMCAQLLDLNLYYQTYGNNQVVLTLVNKQIDYRLFPTFGFSDEGLDVCKRIAAKKAIEMLRTLNSK